ARHHDEIGIDAVGRSFLSDPPEGGFQVDQRIGKRGTRAQPVVGADADPTLRGEMQHERQALLVLAPEHPAAAVYLEQRGTAGGVVAVTVDVEAEAMAGPLAVRDVPRPLDRSEEHTS